MFCSVHFDSINSVEMWNQNAPLFFFYLLFHNYSWEKILKKASNNHKFKKKKVSSTIFILVNKEHKLIIIENSDKPNPNGLKPLNSDDLIIIYKCNIIIIIIMRIMN